MKKFIAFCAIAIGLCLASRAQFNFTDQAFLGQRSQSATICTFNYGAITSAILYIQSMGYSSNFTDVSPSVGSWSNTAWAYGFNSSWQENDAGPIVEGTGPAAGQSSLDFTSAGFTGRHYMSLVKNGTPGTVIDGSNQPNTFFVVCTDNAHTGNGATLFSHRPATGSANEAGLIPANDYMVAGGPGVLSGTEPNDGSWTIYSFVFNGTSSYFRTNGVKAGAGNAGTQTFLAPILGNNSATNAGYEGKMWAVLVYAGAMNTNELISVERALNCEAALGKTIPNP